MTKQALRDRYKKRRNTLNATALDKASLAIANKALQLPIWEHTNYHLFLTIQAMKEVDTSYLLHILQGRDKSILVSKSNFDTFKMTHYLLQENTKLVLSTFGIPEPVDGIKLPATTADIVFVPLLAFDKKGNRLGYGKGFYDRFLSECKPDAILIGLSLFDPEIEIPSLPTDIQLHYAITPEKTYCFLK